MIYLDTHVLVRLYLGEAGKLGAAARSAIEKDALLITEDERIHLHYPRAVWKRRTRA
jgi:predicted nucleic acid-binding protein